MLNPNQFTVCQAWVLFQATDAPVETADVGAIHVLVLMDVASTFAFGTTPFPAMFTTPPRFAVEKLIDEALLKSKGRLPERLIVTTGLAGAGVIAEAKRRGISVEEVSIEDLGMVIGDFREQISTHIPGVGAAARNAADTDAGG